MQKNSWEKYQIFEFEWPGLCKYRNTGTIKWIWQCIIPSKCYFFSRFDWCLVCIEVKRIMMKYFCQTKLIKINMCWRIVSMSNILERNKRKPVLAMNTKNAVNKRKFSNIHIVYLHSLSITYIFSCSYLIIWIDKQNKSQEKLNTKKSIFCESKKICFCHQIFHVLSWNHIVGSYVLFCKIQCL